MHIDILRSEDIMSLLQQCRKPSVSAYFPTMVSGSDHQQNHIRFKNILSQSRQRLIDYGTESGRSDSILHPAHLLPGDTRNWKHGGRGIAMFAAEEYFRIYSIPYHVEEKVTVSDRFHVMPVVPLMSDNGSYFILALSLNAVRLYRADHYSIREVDLPGIPRSLSEALKYDDPERQHQFHTHTGHKTGRTGRGEAIYHGHGVGIEEKKVNILRFCQMIDKGLGDHLKDDNAPLVLAAVDYIHPIFHQAVGYRHVTDKGIVGNPDNISPQVLLDSAWDIVEPQLHAHREKQRERVPALFQSGQSSTDPEKVVPASAEGRVDTLFVAGDAELRGAWDAGTGRTTINDHGDHDLIELAVNQTILNSGVVYSDSRDHIPGNAAMAAIFRY